MLTAASRCLTCVAVVEVPVSPLDCSVRDAAREVVTLARGGRGSTSSPSRGSVTTRSPPCPSGCI